MPPSDEQLAVQAQQGCSASFEELVRRCQAPLLHFLSRRTMIAADAEDLTQETFVRAYQNLHRYRPLWRFATWLFAIARRLSINQQRRVRSAQDMGQLQFVQAVVPQPVQVLVEEESRRQLWDLAAKTLTEQQFTALWLYYVEDMPIGRIAPVLERSPAAVKAMLFRARKTLLPHLEEFLEIGASTDEFLGSPTRSSGRKAAEVAHV